MTPEQASAAATVALASDLEMILRGMADDAGRVGLNDAIRVLDTYREHAVPELETLRPEQETP
jgi:hypothetical protein